LVCHIAIENGAQCAQDFFFSFSSRTASGSLVARRFHREDADELQQVALDHVAQCAGLIVELATPLDTQLLGHVICTWRMRPRRHNGSNNVLPKRQRYQVLHRPCPIVIDAVDLMLRKHSPNNCG